MTEFSDAASTDASNEMERSAGVNIGMYLGK
jgi:hypothetical protein